MRVKNLLFDSSTELSQSDADRLSTGLSSHYVTEVLPPYHGDVPATLNRFVKNVREVQSKWFKLQNTSPVVAMEIRRSHPDRLRFQFATDNIRVDRSIRNGLYEEMPDVETREGAGGLPVSPGDTVGGGFLTLGESDWYPLETDLDRPWVDGLVSQLHESSMRDTSVLVQILMQPVAGDRFRRWWWRRQAMSQIRYLRGDKVSLFPGRDRNAIPREKTQSDLIADKVGSPRFHVSIRVVVIGAGEYTRSRFKEVSNPFGSLESDDTGQYFNQQTVKGIREKPFIMFAESVRNREFGGRAFRFQLSNEELAGLVAVPSIEQENISYSQ